MKKTKNSTPVTVERCRIVNRTIRPEMIKQKINVSQSKVTTLSEKDIKEGNSKKAFDTPNK